MSNILKKTRYKYEKEDVIIEVGVKKSRQLFNERDPAPFRERDLDPDFVTYLVSSVEEFPLRTKMQIRILSSDNEDLRPENILAIQEAIKSYFQYEAATLMAKLRKQNRTARYFLLIGLAVLIVCLALAHLMDSIQATRGLSNIASVSFIIIGWVAIWHPVDALLYGWWPLREQRRYFEKIAFLKVEVISSDT